MKLFTNNTARFFKQVKQFVTYSGGDRAYATVDDVNEIVSRVTNYYTFMPKPGAEDGGEKAYKNEVLNPVTTEVNFSAVVIDQTVTNALDVPNFLDFYKFKTNVDSPQFKIEKFDIIVKSGTAAWDGGDLEIWLGVAGTGTGTLLATVDSALLTTSAPMQAKKITVYPSTTFVAASGSVDAVSGDINFVDNDMLILKLTAKTTLFNGQVIITTQSLGDAWENSCGLCQKNCGDKDWDMYCSVLASGNLNAGRCKTCPTLGTSYGPANVQ